MINIACNFIKKYDFAPSNDKLFLNRFADMALEKLPVGRFGDPDELSNLACYLLSDYSSFITGEVLKWKFIG